MTKRDLFILLIRATAIYHLIVSVLEFVPNIGFYLNEWNPTLLLGLGIPNLLYAGVLVFVLLKTESIVNLFGMSKGFDSDKIETKNIGIPELVKIIVLFLGVFLIFTGAPRFISLIFYWFKDSVPITIYSIMIDNVREPTFVFSNRIDVLALAIKILFGFILVRYPMYVSNKLLGLIKEKRDPGIFNDK